jgi:hypothetical protein
MKTLTLFLTLVSMNAFAWGPTGHRAVGAIAEKYLDLPVALKISQILDKQSLAKVSTWPDEIKSAPQTYSYTYSWHYTEWKDESHDHDEASSSGKLISSLREQAAILKDPAATKEKKSFALKFLVHLIGDLHMPFHVGNGLDQGGNKCRVTFHGKQTNLHALWDEGMIDFSKLSFSELAAFTSQVRTREEILAWKSGDILDWARESKELRATIYPDSTNAKQYCQSEIFNSQEAIPKLAYEYSYKFMPVIEQRLFQAGLRLAVVLNEALK